MNLIIDIAKNKFSRESFIYKTAKKIYMLPRVLFSKYGYMYNYIVFPIQGLLRTHHIRPFYNSNIEKIESLKDKHKGKRCFIIATGPSLRIEDVELLENEITIGVNTFCQIYSKTDFRPTYYAMLDPDFESFLEKNKELEVEKFSKDTVFLNSIMEKKFKSACYIPVCYQNHWFNYYNPKFNYDKNLKHTENIIYGVYDKYTIVNAAIDIAIFLGCTEIYLLGVDCNYKGKEKHFSGQGKDVFSIDSLKAELIHKAMISGFKFMARETQKRGIHVYNATRGGMLEEFERVDLDSLHF